MDVIAETFKHEVAKTHKAYRRGLDMQPGLQGLARSLTGNPYIALKVTGGVASCTDGETIWVVPPAEAGDDFIHQRSKCDRYNHMGAPLCSACEMGEAILRCAEHEIAHLTQGSFDIKIDEMSWLIEAAVRKSVERKYSDSKPEEVRSLVKRQVLNLKKCAKEEPLAVFQQCAHVISPWLSNMWNAIEDGRVNRALHKVRPGSQRYFQYNYERILARPIVLPDGSLVRLHERDIETQIMMMICIASMGYDVDWRKYFDNEAIEIALSLEVTNILDQVATAKYVHQTMRLAKDLIDVLNGKGYLLEPEPQPEPDLSEEDDDSGDDSDSSEPPSGSPGSNSDNNSTNNESDRSDDREDGTDGDRDGSDTKPNDADESDPRSGDDDVSAESGDDGSSDVASVDDDGDPESADESDGSPSDAGSEEGTADADENESAPSATAPGDGAPGTVEHDAKPADPVEEFERELEEFIKKAARAASDLQIFTGHLDDVDDEAKYFDENEFEVPEDSERADPEDNIPDEPTWDKPSNEKVAAETQHEHFDKSANGIGRVHVLKFRDQHTREWPLNTRQVLKDSRKGTKHLANHKVEGAKEVATRSVSRARLVFTENRLSRKQRNLKRGRLSTNAGPRLKVGDDKVFSQKKFPGKKSYSVLIGLDVSGSTGVGLLERMKHSALCQAELLDKLGIPFAFYCHSGERGAVTGTYDLTLFEIKSFGEPWTDETRYRLQCMQNQRANLDGHTMQSYRKMLERQPTTDRILLYYTDGAMPAENTLEERKVLLAECKLINSLPDIHVLAVAVGTNDPDKYGLESVHLDSADDIEKVTAALERKLEG